MSSKNISIREEAYETLSARKRDDESFSDVILRLAGRRTEADVRAFAGFMGEGFADAMAASERTVAEDLETLRETNEAR